MKRLPICKYCQFYANSRYLICTQHPTGVADEADNCADFSGTSSILTTSSELFNIEDLDLAAKVVTNLGYGEPEANQPLVTALAELIHDPLEKFLEQPLSDFFYYVLRLSQLVTSLTRFTPLELLQQREQQRPADRNSILLHQAKFLLKHGSTEILTPARRQFLYGHDQYIAKRISNYLSRKYQLAASINQAYFDDLLERISSNANLHGIDAVGRLYESELLFGYEYPPDFEYNEWEIWENREKYPSVPFSVARTLAFVKQRFDIVLDYPF